MANGELPQKHLLTLIRNFATEKSQGERRVSDLKNRLRDLQNDVDSANADLERTKRFKEAAEQDLRGSQVKLSMTDSSILAQETRISLLQEEISKVRSRLTELKNAESNQRDEFIVTMYELNKKIRQFLETKVHVFQKQYCSGLSSENGQSIINKEEVLPIEGITRGLNNKISDINTQMQKLEEDYRKELNDHSEICQEMACAERRCFLSEAVIRETKELQELSGQISEWEKLHASLGEELQMRFTCPRCQFNNIGVVEGTSEAN